jgi:hypothetical protein
MTQQQRAKLMQERLRNQIARETTGQLVKDIGMSALPTTPKKVVSQLTVTGAAMGVAHLLDASGMGMGITGAVASLAIMGIRMAIESKEEIAELNTRLRTGNPTPESNVVEKEIAAEQYASDKADGKAGLSCQTCGNVLANGMTTCPYCASAQ